MKLTLNLTKVDNDVIFYLTDCVNNKSLAHSYSLTSWSYYGHIMVHNTVTNRRSHTHYDNQTIHNLL